MLSVKTPFMITPLEVAIALAVISLAACERIYPSR
jgi:hypothetical protein